MVKVTNIRKGERFSSVKVFIPNAENPQTNLIREAFEGARYNLDIQMDEYPIDTRAENAIASSNVTSDIVANLIASGYSSKDVNVFMLEKDIKTEDLAWCFGATHGHYILISGHRIWHSSYPNEVKKAMLMYLLEHEIGHAYHAADDIRASGIYDKHCTDLTCAMQQVPNLAILAEKARYNLACRDKYEAQCFCAHCEDRFRRYYGR